MVSTGGPAREKLPGVETGRRFAEHALFGDDDVEAAPHSRFCR
jgi:hypothetical protein